MPALDGDISNFCSDLLHHAATAPQGRQSPRTKEAWSKSTVVGVELLMAEAMEHEDRKREAVKKAEKERKMRELQKKQSDMDRERRETLKAEKVAAEQKKKQVMAEANRRVQEQKKAREQEEWRNVFEQCKANKEKAEKQRMMEQFNEEHLALSSEIRASAGGGKPFDYKRMIDWIAKVEASGCRVGLTPKQWATHKGAMEQAFAAQRAKEQEARGPNPTQGRGGGKGRGRGRGRGLAAASGRGGGGGTCPDRQPQPQPPAPESDHNADALQTQLSQEREAVRRAQEERYKALKNAAATAAASSNSPPSAPPQASAEGNKDDECVICWNATATHVVVPCGHLCMCPDCVPKELNSCPVCRGPMAHVMKVYRP